MIPTRSTLLKVFVPSHNFVINRYLFLQGPSKNRTQTFTPFSSRHSRNNYQLHRLVPTTPVKMEEQKSPVEKADAGATKIKVAALKNNKRSRDDKRGNFQGKSRYKKKKFIKDKKQAKNQTRRAFDPDIDERDRAPHEGSFANPALREQFGVSLEPRIIIDESQKTMKRKVGLFLGFLGTKYGGFQVNNNQRSIQAEIELALYRSGMISTANFGLPHKYSWSSSARTDKGVHACAQFCSVKVELLESDLESNDGLEAARQRVEEYMPVDIRVLDMLRTTRNMCAKTQRDRVRYQYMIPSFLLHPDWKVVLTDQGIPLTGRQDVGKEPLTDEEIKKVKSSLDDFRCTAEQRKLLENALSKYEGTNPFHNFTRGIKPGQPQANRFIEYFRVQDPVVIDGVEWIPTQVLGQSFLLHQIRKMISMAIDVTRGVASLDVMEKALNEEEVVRIGIAPAQGLFLEMSYFGGYNRRKVQNQDLPNLDWSVDGPAKDRWQAMRNKIRQHIVEEEMQQGNFIQYMYTQEVFFEHQKFYKLDEKPYDGNEQDEGNEDSTPAAT